MDDVESAHASVVGAVCDVERWSGQATGSRTHGVAQAFEVGDHPTVWGLVVAAG